MRAYASAQATPVGSEAQCSTRPAMVEGGKVTGIAGRSDRANGVESPPSMLASLIVDGLDDQGLAALARRLLPHQGSPHSQRSQAISHTPWHPSPASSVCRRRRFGARSAVANCRRSSEVRVGSSRQMRSVPGRRHQTSRAGPAVPGSRQLRRRRDPRWGPCSPKPWVGVVHDERREGEAGPWGNRMARSMAPTRAQSCADVQYAPGRRRFRCGRATSPSGGRSSGD
jgi:hypothetical protein